MAKLTRSDKKQIEAILARYKTNDRTTMSAQDSIPFQRMYPDGICRVTENTYSKTIQFADINYMLNTNDDKSAIFDGWCDFLTIKEQIHKNTKNQREPTIQYKA